MSQSAPLVDTDAESDVIVEVMTMEELWEELDRRARELLGISADEFADRYRRGELPDTPAVNQVSIFYSFVDHPSVRA